MSQGNPDRRQAIKAKVSKAGVPKVIFQAISEQYTNSLWTGDCFLLAFMQPGPGSGLAAIVAASMDSQES